MALDGPAAHRHRRHRRRDPRPAGRVGGVGSPRDLHRPAGGLPQVQGALARGQDRRRLPELRLDRVHRAAGLQPDVQDPGRPGRGRGRDGLPAPRDGPGHVHELRQRARDHGARSRPSASPRSASPSATRSRRRTSSFARASSSRWRWSTSSPRPTPTSGTATGSRRASTGTSTSASPRRQLRLSRARQRGPLALLRGTTDVEFDFPWGFDELEGVANRGDYDLTQHAKASGVKLEYFDSGDERALHALRHRAGRRRDARDDGVPARRLLTRTRSRARRARVLRLDWRLAPYQVAVLPLSKKPELEGVSRAKCSTRCSRTSCATTTSPSRSAAATGARTRSARRVA